MRRKAIKVVGIALLVLAGLLALTYALRDPLATRVLALVLERKSDMHCTKPEVSIAAALDVVHIGALECTRSIGPMRYFAAKSGIEVSLRNFSAERVQMKAADVDLRERDVSHVQMVNLGGELGKLVGFSESLVKGNLDSHDMYANDSPRVVIDSVRVTRAGKLEAVMYAFEKSTGGRWDRTFARSVKMPGMSGIAAIQAFDVRVTRTRAETSASVYLGSTPKPGAQPDLNLKVAGVRLESDAPRFQLKLET